MTERGIECDRDRARVRAGSSTERAELLYARARALPPSERTAFVREACPDDPALRDEVLSLLNVADAAATFFDRLGDAVTSQASEPRYRDAASAGSGAVQRYRIVERIGSGGMGTIYRARDTRLGRDVALKFLPPRIASGSKAETTLLNEARAAAALVHPNICTIHEIGETADGQPFIAMAFYEGESLAARLRRGSLEPSEAARIAIHLARGLGAAHAHGIVHRDVKPGNVMLAADGTVKLLDFGIAQMADAVLVRTRRTRGTIPYMSPEQLSGEPVGPRADLWALGVVLYEMLTGERPFGAADERASVHAILRREPIPIRRRRPEAPEPLVRIVERLLRKPATERYATAAEVEAELVAAIRATARDRDVEDLAWRGSGPRRGRRTRLAHRAHRRRVPLVASAVLCGALLAGAVWLPRGGPPSFGAARSPDPGFIAARELYRRGCDQSVFRSTSTLRQGIADLLQAIDRDRDFAAAHACLAMQYLVLSGHGARGAPAGELRASAREAATTAVALDDSNAEAHAAFGLIADRLDRDADAAVRALERAVELDPADPRFREWLAQLYIRMDLPSDALRLARQAVENDPTRAAAHAELAHALLANGRYDDALAQLDAIADLDPPLLRAAPFVAQAYALKGLWAEAVDALRPQVERGDVQSLPLYGYLLARAGRTGEAGEVRDTLFYRWQRGEHGAFGVAVLHAGLGDLNEAFRWLDHAFDDGSATFGPVNIMEPIFIELREDPRFARIRARLARSAR